MSRYVVTITRCGELRGRRVCVDAASRDDARQLAVRKLYPRVPGARLVPDPDTLSADPLLYAFLVGRANEHLSARELYLPARLRVVADEVSQELDSGGLAVPRWAAAAAALHRGADAEA